MKFLLGQGLDKGAEDINKQTAVQLLRSMYPVGTDGYSARQYIEHLLA